MGRFTSFFGVNCIADTVDTKEYLKMIAKQTLEKTEILTYNIIPK